MSQHPLSIVRHLRELGLESLEADGIISRRHKTYPHLVLLKYRRNDVDFSKEHIRQCRGIILDENNDWEVVSYPFDKFFNYGDPLAVGIDWKSARVEEKLDGSCIQAYYYDNNWQVGTLGSPDASGNVGDNGLTFKQLFYSVWGDRFDHVCLNINMTYMFELRTPLNQVVVPATANSLTLIGIRDNTTLQEYDPEAAHIGEPLHIFSNGNTTIEEVVKSASKIDPMQQEGFVVKDKYFNRIKVKSPRYVQLHLVKSNMTPKRMLEIIRSGESDEFVSYFPEMKPLHYKIKNLYEGLIERTAMTFFTVCNDFKANGLDCSNEKREFSKCALQYPFSAALFAQNNNSIPPEDFYRDLHIDSLVRLLELKDKNISDNAQTPILE